MKLWFLLLLAPVSALAQTCTPAPCLNVAWTAPTVNADGTSFAPGTTLTYNLYSAPQGSPLASVAMNLTALSSLRTNVVAGTTYCYAVTATAHVAGVAGAESAQTSPPVCAAPAAPAQATPATPAAPGGVTVTSTVSTTAYRMRQSVDGYTWVALGTVALGTACDASHSADGVYRPIPRSAVTLTSRFDTLPLIVWAQCS
jgi:hypothetical protein